MLYRTQPTPAQEIRGRFLAHNGLPAHRRAFLAADLVLGRTLLAKPTLQQAAALARVCGPYVTAARDIIEVAPHIRPEIENGTIPLIRMSAAHDGLVNAWRAADPATRVEFARQVGVAQIWDTAIAPAI